SFTATRLPPYTLTTVFRRPLPTANATAGDDGYPLWRATGDAGTVILKFFSSSDRKEANAQRAEFAVLKRLLAGGRGAGAYNVASFFGAKEAPQGFLYHIFEDCTCTFEEFVGTVHKEYQWGQPSHRNRIFQELKGACEDVVSGLIHCHENDVVYGEIRSHSIWGTQTRRGYTWKLGDFYTSHRKGDIIPVESSFITPERALSLRLLRDKTHADHNSNSSTALDAFASEAMDAFALGCWLIEIFTKAPPSFRRLTRSDQIEVLSGPGIVAVPEGVSEMVGRLVMKNERARMSVEGFKDSSFWAPKSPGGALSSTRSINIPSSPSTQDLHSIPAVMSPDKLASSMSGLSLEIQNRVPMKQDSLNLSQMDGTIPYLLGLRDMHIPGLFVLLPNYEMPRTIPTPSSTSLHLICEFDRQQHILPTGYPLSATDIVDAGLASFVLASLKTVCDSAGESGYHFVKQGRGAGAGTVRIGNRDLKQDCEDVCMRLITRGRGAGGEDTLRIAARALMWLKSKFFFLATTCSGSLDLINVGFIVPIGFLEDHDHENHFGGLEYVSCRGGMRWICPQHMQANNVPHRVGSSTALHQQTYQNDFPQQPYGFLGQQQSPRGFSPQRGYSQNGANGGTTSPFATGPPTSSLPPVPVGHEVGGMVGQNQQNGHGGQQMGQQNGYMTTPHQAHHQTQPQQFQQFQPQGYQNGYPNQPQQQQLQQMPQQLPPTIIHQPLPDMLDTASSIGDTVTEYQYGYPNQALVNNQFPASPTTAGGGKTVISSGSSSIGGTTVNLQGYGGNKPLPVRKVIFTGYPGSGKSCLIFRKKVGEFKVHS
ncbi:hypothetical protein HK097_003802, partial [Rhizophlyctis rosea]